MLHARLRRLARRLRLRAAAGGALLGLQAGLAAGLLLLAASKLHPFPHALWIALACVPAGLLAGAVAAGSRRVAPLRAAIEADRAAGTDEVLSTAWECALESDRFSRANVERAEKILASHPDRELLPKRRARAPLAALAMAAAFAALLWVPALGWITPPGDEPAALNPRVLQALEKSARDVKRAGEQLENRELARLGAEIKKLADAAKLGDISRKEALAKIAELSERAEEIRRQMEEKKEALAKLEKSGEAKALADALAKGDQHGAKSQAEEMARRLAGGEMSGEQKKGLKSTLDSIAKGSDGELGQAAKEAAEALEGGDAKQFGERMSELAEKMKGARGQGRSVKPGQTGKGGQGSPQESAQAEGEPELDDAMEDLSDAKDELSGEGESGADGKAGQSGKHCEDCGRRKSEGGG